ncbi:hypothetical protein ACFVU3_08030 [Streptomyces sp. NPDC058052]|uniref:hypothetical protein n=1 Tax=Streptomyces sp. NPDC058052 TaxID=3346316 RepID=UPI0036EDC439
MSTDAPATPSPHAECAAAGQHHYTWERGIRAVEVTSDDKRWAQYVHDGTMHVLCCCGLDTGWTDQPEAMRLVEEHLAQQPT